MRRLVLTLSLAASSEYVVACYIESSAAIFYALTLPGIAIVAFNFVMFVFVAKEIRDTLQSDPSGSSPQKRQRRRAFRVYSSIFISIGLPWIVAFIGSFLPRNADRFSEDPPSNGLVVSGCFTLFSPFFHYF